MIVFKDFSFRYEEREQPTLRSIDLEIADGECVLLTGRSGCSKTTLIRSLNGLIPHFYPGEIHGTLELDGESLLEKTPSELAGRVGTVFQDPRSQFFMTDTTRELAFGCENLGLTREKTVTRVANAVRTLRWKIFSGAAFFRFRVARSSRSRSVRFTQCSRALSFSMSRRPIWIMRRRIGWR